MKKRVKKASGSFFGKVLIVLSKLIFVYPFKGIYFILKLIGRKITSAYVKQKEISKKKKAESQRPKIIAKYSPLREIRNKTGSFSAFEKKLMTNKSTIGIILGARGTGKTAIGTRILENFAAKSEKYAYALGFKEEELPAWIKVIRSVEEIDTNAVLLIDEGGIEFSSRNSMSKANKILSDILLIARHKDLSVIFIAQNSTNLEINAIRQADYLILKPSSLLQKDFERKKIREMYQEVEKDFTELAETEGITYIYADNYQGFVVNTLPSFWSEKVSKGYRRK
ncbi:hypothetical protein HYT52_01390 [Candidatus Woesearchaeota archaeon]|nr:hypothetical protein [Candidatus Woesearchaeota archaeon]